MKSQWDFQLEMSKILPVKMQFAERKKTLKYSYALSYEEQRFDFKTFNFPWNLNFSEIPASTIVEIQQIQ